MDMNNYKPTKNGVYRYILVLIDNFSKISWCIPLNSTYAQTKADDFPKILTTSGRSNSRIESHRGAKFSTSNFIKFLKLNIIRHF